MLGNSVQRYRDTKALSQSSLKLLENDPKSFYADVERWLIGQIPEQPEFKETEYMKLGSLVDCLILTPELFTETYVVAHKAPRAQMLSFTDLYIKKEREASKGYTEKLSKEVVTKLAQETYDEVGIKKDSLAKILERFKTEAIDYYNAWRNAGDKTVLSPEMHSQAMWLVSRLQADKFSSDLLFNNGWQPDERSFYNQIDLYATIGATNSVNIKGLLDRIIVNHRDKTIQGIDLKTSSDDNFESSMIKYRYDLQGAFYIQLLTVWAEKDAKLKMYDVLPFKFVSVNTVSGRVDVWKLSDTDEDAGVWGATTHYGRKTSGYMSLIKDYLWHKQKDVWDYPRHIYENKGRLTNLYV